MLSIRKPLDLFPVFVRFELLPGSAHHLFIGPREQVHELCSLARFAFPHGDDVKAVGPHDPCRVVAESVMKRGLVVVENFVDPELMNHF